jgi:D-glycero-D-manno-heptose 1,7-bisphosphate phosphatase
MTGTAMRNRALFIDRDGVLNENYVRNGKPYAPRSFAEFKLMPGIGEAARRAKAAGFLLILVSNQPDIADGFTPRAEFDAMQALLTKTIPFDDLKICFHTKNDNCDCRKPKPGMLLEAAADHDIDLKASYFVGDRWRDVLAGQAAGVFTILVETGLKQDEPITPEKTVSSLPEAIDFILTRESKNGG